MADPEKRAAVERAAIDQAIRFYSGDGFEVEERGKPYVSTPVEN